MGEAEMNDIENKNQIVAQAATLLTWLHFSGVYSNDFCILAEFGGLKFAF